MGLCSQYAGTCQSFASGEPSAHFLGYLIDKFIVI